MIQESESFLLLSNENVNENSIEIKNKSEEYSPEGSSTDISKNKKCSEKYVQLPLARIKNIMKMDPDVNIVSHEAVFLVAKATELFIESLARETYLVTVKGKKKTIHKRDLDAAIDAIDALCFLEGTLDPEK